MRCHTLRFTKKTTVATPPLAPFNVAGPVPYLLPLIYRHQGWQGRHSSPMSALEHRAWLKHSTAPFHSPQRGIRGKRKASGVTSAAEPPPTCRTAPAVLPRAAPDLRPGLLHTSTRYFLVLPLHNAPFLLLAVHYQGLGAQWACDLIG